MLHEFVLKGQKVRLWQRAGESFEHVLLKALGFAMFVDEFPQLKIEAEVGLRYKPDLIVFGENRQFRFWGECGQNPIRKTRWLLKHTRTEELVLFKIAINSEQLIKQIREEIPPKYRENGRLKLINFCDNIVKLTESKHIAKVEKDWFEKFEI
jgi:hypothetical protein